MIKCTGCGNDVDESYLFCPYCGARITTGCDFASAPADPFNNVPSGSGQAPQPDPFSSVPSNNGQVSQPDPFNTVPSNNGQASQPDPFNTVPSNNGQPKHSVKEKFHQKITDAEAFESKHHIIINLLVLICAAVVLFVAVFAPVKVPDYFLMTGEYGIALDDYDFDEKEVDIEGSYLELDQTIFQIIGALFYASPSAGQIKSIDSECERARTRAETDFNVWAALHPLADEEEAIEMAYEIAAMHFSEVNYFAYVFAMTESEVTIPESVTIMLWLSLGIALVTVAIALATAVVALVHIVKAVLGMARRRTSVSPTKYLRGTLKLAGAGLLLTLVNPMLAPGGMPFAVALFAAIALAVVCTVSLVVSGGGIVEIAKYAALSVTSILAFFLLCSNTLAVSYAFRDAMNIKLRTTPGFWTAMLLISAEEPNSYLMVGTALDVLVGIVAPTLALAACTATLDSSKNAGMPQIAVAAAAILLTVILGFASLRIVDALAEALDTDAAVFDGKIYASGTVWAAFIFSVSNMFIAFGFKEYGKRASGKGGKTQAPTV